MTRITPAFLVAGFALLPAAVWAGANGERILACTADRAQPGCATLLTRLFVCDRASALPGCADLLAARDAALAESETEDEPLEESTEGSSEDSAAATPETGLPGCPVIEASGWRAQVAPVEGEDGLQLIVEGTVLLPTPGYAVSLTPGMADRSARPVQVIELQAQAPTGMVPQVLSVYDLRLVTPSIGQVIDSQPPYRGVRLVCGGTEIAAIETVELAE